MLKPKDKFIGFFSVTPNKKFMRLFERAGIQNVLISYHYIKKHLEYMEEELFPRINSWGGLFMTDSGIFSMANDPEFDSGSFDWYAYAEEYSEFLKKHKKYISLACNLDAETFIGHDIVAKMNKIYFEPLKDEVQMIYLAHKTEDMGDLGLVKRYAKQYDYIGVNEGMTRYAPEIFQLSRTEKCAVHGFAWTKPTLLKDYPFTSVDSSSWVNYQKFGATPVWDGVNFSQYDGGNKDIRRTLKKQCTKYGVGFDEFVTEKNLDGSHNDDEGLTYSLRTWLDVLDNLKKYANGNHKTVEDIVNAGEFEWAYKKKSLADRVSEDAPSRGKEVMDSRDPEAATSVRKREGKVKPTEIEEEHGDILMCDTCYIADQCPKFKAGESCGIDFSIDTSDKNPLQLMDRLISFQFERVNRAIAIEKSQGGMPSKVNTSELQLLQRFAEAKADMITKAQTRGVTYKEERTVSVQSNAESSGGGFKDMLGQIMGEDKK